MTKVVLVLLGTQKSSFETTGVLVALDMGMVFLC